MSTIQSVRVAAINAEPFSEVIWDPTQVELCKLSNITISVRETHDEQAIWEVVRSHLDTTIDQEKLKQALGVALDELQDLAVAHLVLPKGGEQVAQGVTRSIVEILKNERQAYADALSKLPDAQSLNEVLRIAYNFAGDATNFIRLLVSICDLKPVVLWATLASHFALSEKFRSLPWARRRNKPSLKNYESTIKDARNSVFHNLFPFRKSLSVVLPEESLGIAELRIFSEHAKKKDNALNYSDKPLVDVLIGFTRAREVRVAEHFWKKNVEVMDATIALLEDTDSVVRLIHP